MRVMKVAFAIAVLIFTAHPLYASQAQDGQALAGEAADKATAQTAIDIAVAAEAPDEDQVDIMDVPLDGSSVDAFKAGLEQLDLQASEKQYRSVMSSLDYLLFYDLSAQRSKARLYANLDGMSPNQIIDLVRNERNSQ